MLTQKWWREEMINNSNYCSLIFRWTFLSISWFTALLTRVRSTPLLPAFSITRKRFAFWVRSLLFGGVLTEINVSCRRWYIWPPPETEFSYKPLTVGVVGSLKAGTRVVASNAQRILKATIIHTLILQKQLINGDLPRTNLWNDPFPTFRETMIIVAFTISIDGWGIGSVWWLYKLNSRWLDWLFIIA